MIDCTVTVSNEWQIDRTRGSVCVCDRDTNVARGEPTATWCAHLSRVYGPRSERGVSAMWTSRLLRQLLAGTAQLCRLSQSHPRHRQSLSHVTQPRNAALLYIVMTTNADELLSFVVVTCARTQGLSVLKCYISMSMSYGDCLEGKRGYYLTSSVLLCITIVHIICTPI